MATLILVHATYDEAHLAEVTEYMREHGSPTLHAVECTGVYYLLEGCHRARAAAALGLPVRLQLVDYDAEQDGDRLVSEMGLGITDAEGSMGSIVGSGSSEQCWHDGAWRTLDRSLRCDVELA